MNSTEPRYALKLAQWTRDAPALRAVREAVFVSEQNVPPELEWDGLDAQCVHVLAEIDDRVVGTGRLLPDGHIGRMAVLPQWRGQGIGTAILGMLLDIANSAGHRRVELHAQSHALTFYSRAGFVPEGAEFMEAGIPHRRMVKTL